MGKLKSFFQELAEKYEQLGEKYDYDDMEFYFANLKKKKKKKVIYKKTIKK